MKRCLEELVVESRAQRMVRGILFRLPLNVLGPVEIKMGEETQQCQSISLSQQEEEPEVRNSSQSGERCSEAEERKVLSRSRARDGAGDGRLSLSSFPSPASSEWQSGPGLLRPDSASAISSH